MTAPVREGEILAGKYRVECVLGQGGMGVVVAARHTQLGQQVALKFLHPAVCENPDAVARFLREAQATVQIRSEHVARILDVGTLETGAPYIVMEFLSGADLGQVLQSRGPLPVAEAVSFVLQACEALAEAHACGIVHRDLKPTNLFLTSRADGSPLVKVLDFGISKTTGAGASPGPVSVTSTATIMGSPAYMSPEQIRSSKHVDARTDIWALGVVLHQLASGHLPFEGESATEIMAMVVADPPTPLRRALSTAPAGLEDVILRCLEKTPEKRVANVGVLAQALAPFAPDSGRMSVERIVRVLALPAPGSATLMAPEHTILAPEPSGGAGKTRESTDGAWGTTGAPPPRRVGKAILVLGGVAVLAVVGGALFFTERGAPPPAATGASPPGITSPPAPQAVPTVPSTPAADPAPPRVVDDPIRPGLGGANAEEPPAPTTSARPRPVQVDRSPVAAPPRGRPPAQASPPASPGDLFNDTK